MFLVTHAAIGAAIGQATGNPILAALGGLASHFLLDAVPHGDLQLYKSYKSGQKVRRAIAKVTVDSIVTIIFVILLFNFRDFMHPGNVSLGIAFSVLPDALIGLYEIHKTRFLTWFNQFHFFFHNYFVKKVGDVSYKYGMVLQIIILIMLQTKVF
ncbi:MAG: hypothetical protein UT32_C0048G0001 [Parcubacteria group bacterium GW2011_GWC2_39_14]|nr:MAG: hypothetical protein UT32_C0048G0001 [Parcubacteria group bacterium GW2011_GWC2_39_14]